jgi:hypothetical protein
MAFFDVFCPFFALLLSIESYSKLDFCEKKRSKRVKKGLKTYIFAQFSQKKCQFRAFLALEALSGGAVFGTKNPGSHQLNFFFICSRDQTSGVVITGAFDFDDFSVSKWADGGESVGR